MNMFLVHFGMAIIRTIQAETATLPNYTTVTSIVNYRLKTHGVTGLNRVEFHVLKISFSIGYLGRSIFSITTGIKFVFSAIYSTAFSLFISANYLTSRKHVALPLVILWAPNREERTEKRAQRKEHRDESTEKRAQRRQHREDSTEKTAQRREHSEESTAKSRGALQT
jgi:hypothetical protein